jgi:hypothetical protein
MRTMPFEDGNQEREQRKKRGKGERNSQSNSSPPTSRASLTMATPAFYVTHVLDLLIRPERGHEEVKGRQKSWRGEGIRRVERMMDIARERK